MVTILNELSLNSQYDNIDEFKKYIKKTLIILRTLNVFKIPISKNREFYNLKISSIHSVYDLLKLKDDEVRALRSELTRFCIDEPYWENSQKHTCDDEYKCHFTNKTCEYGLAESAENYQTIISFYHPDFNSNKIEISKNGSIIQLYNIYDLDSMIIFILNCINDNIITDEGISQDFLPSSSISNNLLELNTFQELVSGISHEEQIVLYKSIGKKTALINFWIIDNIITSRNDRDVYSKKILGKQHYLTIDTENGTFELFDSNGKHLGEFNFKGDRTQNIRTHTINLS